MEPEVIALEQEQEELTIQEQKNKDREDKKLQEMIGNLYKPDYKIYIFKGDEMYNEEFIAAIDNSPTYKRTAQELERMVAMLGEGKPADSVAENKNETVKEEEKDDDDDFTPGVPVYYNNEINNKNINQTVESGFEN